MSVVWGRGAGEGIGLSGHKNEYRAGVNIGNWVEEQFGREAHSCGDSLKDFMATREAARIEMGRKPWERSKPVRSRTDDGVPAPMLFSHGKEANTKYEAAMSSLHFTDPTTRSYGPESNDRVHKSFYYGSKHIDAFVPPSDPNPRTNLMVSKGAQWAAEARPSVPVDASMYVSESKGQWTMAAVGK